MQSISMSDSGCLAGQGSLIILTLLFGIELAIARLTPTRCPAPVHQCVVLWYAISILYLLPVFLGDAAFRRCCKSSPTWYWLRWLVYATGGVDSSLNFLYPGYYCACILLRGSGLYLTEPWHSSCM